MQREQKDLLKIFIKSAWLTCFVFLLSACGYSLQTKSDLPFDMISIGNIENKTHEPKLQDKLNSALTETFMEYGFRVVKSARFSIDMEITRFELKTLSEKDLTASEYEVAVKGNFRLRDNEKGSSIQLMDIHSPFVTYFNSTSRLENVLAMKELSINNALKNLSQELVRNIIYKQPKSGDRKPEVK